MLPKIFRQWTVSTIFLQLKWLWSANREDWQQVHPMLDFFTRAQSTFQVQLVVGRHGKFFLAAGQSAAPGP